MADVKGSKKPLYVIIGQGIALMASLIWGVQATMENNPDIKVRKAIVQNVNSQSSTIKNLVDDIIAGDPEKIAKIEEAVENYQKVKGLLEKLVEAKDNPGGQSFLEKLKTRRAERNK